jgi:hypothetical protein
MAGPALDIIASLRKGSNKEIVSEKISELVARYGFGLLSGTDPIRRLYDQEGRMLEQLSVEVENPLVISITDNPKATDAWEIFERQLHPLYADPEKAKILKVLAELWSLEEIQAAVFIIMRVDAEFLPRYEMTFEEFLKSLARYQEKENVNFGRGGRGIFKVTK